MKPSPSFLLPVALAAVVSAVIVFRPTPPSISSHLPTAGRDRGTPAPATESSEAPDLPTNPAHPGKAKSDKSVDELAYLAPEGTLGGRMERLAAKDPLAAIKAAEAYTDPGERAEALGAVVRIWVQLDSAAALAHVRQWEDSALRLLVLEQAGRTLAEEDPKSALALAGEFPAGQAQDDFANVVVHAWSRKQPEAAAEWSTRLPEGTRRDLLQASVAIEWAQEEPAKAADFVATKFSPGPAQDNAALTIAIRWASMAPQDAATWVQQFPAGPLREQLLRGILSHWTARDASASQRWIASLPSGDFRDAAQAAQSPTPLPGNPEAAISVGN